jgi:GNAT superfamily N-acetyltransferase
MRIRRATFEDADDACQVLRRSISELRHADHQGHAPTLTAWLANKTSENVRRWIAENHVFVATEGAEILAVGALNARGEITLNYVSPHARFQGISKAMLAGLEDRAREMAIDTVKLQSTATAHRFYLSAGYRDDGPAAKSFGKLLNQPMVKQIIR